LVPTCGETRVGTFFTASAPSTPVKPSSADRDNPAALKGTEYAFAKPSRYARDRHSQLSGEHYRNHDGASSSLIGLQFRLDVRKAGLPFGMERARHRERLRTDRFRQPEIPARRPLHAKHRAFMGLASQLTLPSTDLARTVCRSGQSSARAGSTKMASACRSNSTYCRSPARTWLSVA
jgi:hypothetical protein